MPPCDIANSSLIMLDAPLSLSHKKVYVVPHTHPVLLPYHFTRTLLLPFFVCNGKEPKTKKGERFAEMIKAEIDGWIRPRPGCQELWLSWVRNASAPSASHQNLQQEQ